MRGEEGGGEAVPGPSHGGASQRNPTDSPRFGVIGLRSSPSEIARALPMNAG